MPKYEIRYYLTETAYKAGVVAHKETLTADRNYVINWAQRKISNSNFKFYDLKEL